MLMFYFKSFYLIVLFYIRCHRDVEDYGCIPPNSRRSSKPPAPPKEIFKKRSVMKQGSLEIINEKPSQFIQTKSSTQSESLDSASSTVTISRSCMVNKIWSTPSMVAQAGSLENRAGQTHESDFRYGSITSENSTSISQSSPGPFIENGQLRKSVYSHDSVSTGDEDTLNVASRPDLLEPVCMSREQRGRPSLSTIASEQSGQVEFASTEGQSHQRSLDEDQETVSITDDNYPETVDTAYIKTPAAAKHMYNIERENCGGNLPESHNKDTDEDSITRSLRPSQSANSEHLFSMPAESTAEHVFAQMSSESYSEHSDSKHPLQTNHNNAVYWELREPACGPKSATINDWSDTSHTESLDSDSEYGIINIKNDGTKHFSDLTEKPSSALLLINHVEKKALRQHDPCDFSNGRENNLIYCQQNFNNILDERISATVDTTSSKSPIADISKKRSPIKESTRVERIKCRVCHQTHLNPCCLTRQKGITYFSSDAAVGKVYKRKKLRSCSIIPLAGSFEKRSTQSSTDTVYQDTERRHSILSDATCFHQLDSDFSVDFDKSKCRSASLIPLVGSLEDRRMLEYSSFSSNTVYRKSTNSNSSTEVRTNQVLNHQYSDPDFCINDDKTHEHSKVVPACMQNETSCFQTELEQTVNNIIEELTNYSVANLDRTAVLDHDNQGTYESKLEDVKCKTRAPDIARQINLGRTISVSTLDMEVSSTADRSDHLNTDSAHSAIEGHLSKRKQQNTIQEHTSLSRQTSQDQFSLEPCIISSSISTSKSSVKRKLGETYSSFPRVLGNQCDGYNSDSNISNADIPCKQNRQGLTNKLYSNPQKWSGNLYLRKTQTYYKCPPTTEEYDKNKQSALPYSKPILVPFRKNKRKKDAAKDGRKKEEGRRNNRHSSHHY